MSIGKLVDPEKALIWRGPMAHGAFKQLLTQTDWGHLDYLIVDLPPGTGDVPLSLAQMLPADRRGDRVYAAEGRAGRCPQGGADVPATGRGSAGLGRKHELVSSANTAPSTTSSVAAARRKWLRR